MKNIDTTVLKGIHQNLYDELLEGTVLTKDEDGEWTPEAEYASYLEDNFSTESVDWTNVKRAVGAVLSIVDEVYESFDDYAKNILEDQGITEEDLATFIEILTEV